MIDFKKRLSAGKTEKKSDPIELYDTLDRKSVAGPLRPAQEYILNEWQHNHRLDKDLIIKLHTGEGKTLIGLLILQSMINSNEGPCLYVCPNKYLVQQVCTEAEKFGIPYCTIEANNEIPDEFTDGTKILIVTAQKIFNGKSIFGVDNDFVRIGTIVLDDSHACIDVIKSSATITIRKNESEALYNKIIELFEEDLIEQGEGSFLDLKSGDYETFMPVPYWSWLDKKSEVLQLLSDNVEDNSIKFAWQIIRDRIKNYRCFISGNEIEISPYNANADVYGSFSHAKHRILMSATTQEDAFFIKGLSFGKEAVRSPLIYKKQKWSGEKMIIIPSLINEECDRDLVVTIFSKLNNEKFGMAAIVPSTRKAEQYKSIGAVCTNSENIYQTIDSLKKKVFNKLVVINNRYDGIDLPDEACRILILDSMPYFGALSERYEKKCRPDSEIINKKLAQKIEQGIGRGVRGEKDYCAILIIGSDLVKFVKSVSTKKYFSLQTQKQIDIGLDIANMAQEEASEDERLMHQTNLLVNQMLRRDDGWKEYYVSEMNSIDNVSAEDFVYEKLLDEARIEKLYSDEEYDKAAIEMQRFIDKYSLDDYEKGWYLQQLARYKYSIHKEESIKIQKTAFKKNTQLLKPKTGIEYTKASYLHESRLKRIKEFLGGYGTFTELMLAVDEVLDNLSFGVDADKFEAALKTLGDLLGFISQRPDMEIRKGPDNLWCGANNEYCFFECKSEVEETRTEINKHEAGQMNSHCGWFEEQYGDITPVGRFMIIGTKELSYYGNFTHDVRIIRRGKLRELKKNVKSFIRELKPYSLDDVSEETLQGLIDIYKLNMDNLVTDYSEKYYHKMK